MKSSLLTASLIIFFLSCTKTDTSLFNATCVDSCTTVQGRFITGNDEGIANISYEIRSEIKPTSGIGQTTIRKIASGKTGNNGSFSSTFGLVKREYGEMADASVSIYFDYDRTKFVLVDWYESFGAAELLGGFRRRRDTTITANIYLTSRSKVKIRLENFTPIQAEDVFSVITTCGAGLDRHYSSGGFVEATQAVTEKEIDACGNEQTTVIVRKRKNGVSSSSSATIATPTGQTVAVTYIY